MIRIALLLFLCLSQTLYSKTVSWDGGGNGIDWADDANWDSNSLPAIGDSVIIAVDSVELRNVEPTIKNLLLLDDAKLTNFSTLSFSESLSYAIRADNSTVINHGKIIVFDVGNNDFEDRAIELINSAHFHNANTSALLHIKQTNGYGIRLESGSSFENDGVVSVVSLYGPGIYLRENSSFTNRHEIDINCQEMSAVVGIEVSAFGLFTNLGNIGLDIDLGNDGLKINHGGTFINESDIIIDIKNSGRGLMIANLNSLMHHKNGSIQIDLTTANGIKLFGGGLIVDPGAVVEVNHPPMNYSLEIDSAAIFDCQGIFEIGN